jgi:hypothetical protein
METSEVDTIVVSSVERRRETQSLLRLEMGVMRVGGVATQT